MLQGIEHVIEFVGQQSAMGVLRNEAGMKVFEVTMRERLLRPAEGAEDFARQAAFAFAEDVFEAVEHVVAIFIAAAADEALSIKVVQCAQRGRFGDRFVLDFRNEKLEEDRPVCAEEVEDMTATGLIEGNIVVGSEPLEEIKGFGVFERGDFADIEIIDGGGEAEATDDGFQANGASDEEPSGGVAEFVASRAKPVQRFFYLFARALLHNEIQECWELVQEKEQRRIGFLEELKELIRRRASRGLFGAGELDLDPVEVDLFQALQKVGGCIFEPLQFGGGFFECGASGCGHFFEPIGDGVMLFEV